METVDVFVAIYFNPFFLFVLLLFIFAVFFGNENLEGFFRNSRPEVLCKKGVLINFAKFTGKHLCQSLFFNKVAGLFPHSD